MEMEALQVAAPFCALQGRKVHPGGPKFLPQGLLLETSNPFAILTSNNTTSSRCGITL